MIEDIKTIVNLVRPNNGKNHEQRIENFYKHQSGNYDSFRNKLLTGRGHFFKQSSQMAPKGVWVDFGAGTGACLDYLSNEQINAYEQVYLVDLSEDLLAVAEKKIASRQLTNVTTVCQDSTDFTPPDLCDLVTFSYSLTMTPQWYRVLDHAYRVMSPQGIIGVVDFYISEKFPLSGLKKHDSWTRNFWPMFFAYDNVFLNPDHLPYLLNRFKKKILFEGEGSLPYFPMGKVPFYSFLGQKDLTD